MIPFPGLFLANVHLEFLAVTMEKSVYLKEEKLAAAFKLFDTNADGSISYVELKDVLGQDESYASKDD